jgi:hypothetical protein
VAGRIDKVELVGFAVFCRKGQRNTLGFNSDTALALDIHGIQHLRGHFPLTEATTELNKAISNGGFAMVDMGNNRKISDMTEI